MVKHIIIWNFKEEYTPQQRAEFAQKIKSELEALVGKVDGLTELKIITNPLGTSNGDVMLDSTLTSIEALEGYQVHPDHVAAAAFVRSVMGNRKCMDFEI
ncbi:MAG: Dabb family protein [Clostridia bacterium]|nr:Dabb family protein [Clostridia bacterium]